jgi:hypothetical protein
MLGAWVAPMLMGVAYRLVGMFTLSEDRLRRDWAWAALALTVGGAWTLGAVLLFGSAPLGNLGWPIRLAASAALLAGQALFAAQLLRLYRGRRRRTFDVHLPFALTSLTFGVLAALLVFYGMATQTRASEPLWVGPAGGRLLAGLDRDSGLLLQDRDLPDLVTRYASPWPSGCRSWMTTTGAGRRRMVA